MQVPSGVSDGGGDRNRSAASWPSKACGKHPPARLISWRTTAISLEKSMNGGGLMTRGFPPNAPVGNKSGNFLNPHATQRTRLGLPLGEQASNQALGERNGVLFPSACLWNITVWLLHRPSIFLEYQMDNHAGVGKAIWTQSRHGFPAFQSGPSGWFY